MTDPHREFCRRQHRIIGQYLAMQAWQRGLDCIVLNRKELQSLMKLERFKGERIRWLFQDIKPWFPYQMKIEYSGSSSLATIYLSRLPLDPYTVGGTLSTEARMAKMTERGAPKMDVYKKKTSEKGPASTEAEIVSYLAVLAAGLGTP